MSACPNCGKQNEADARFCSACGTELAVVRPARGEARKTVTVVFSDVTGSTSLGERLDPESMRRVMGRYFDEMRRALERHGGTVEKFIGDAVMAVFGIPRVHEDDALRAVRATSEMRDRLEALNEELDRDWGVRIETRTGVNTGEVVAGDPSAGQTLVTGDAVNVAARLEQRAAPSEILVGESTYRLVRAAVEAEPVDSVSVKGKTGALTAYRLQRVLERLDAFDRRFESPLVGRRRELSLLQQAFRRAVDEQACHLFTVLGPAGIGKSRLTQEFVAATGADARVVTGRCLPYGDGITYWPLAEIVEQLGREQRIAELLDGERDGRTIVNTVLAALGQADAPVSQEETPWAVRKLFEALARERPLVVVLDDLQWAEPTFLDLVEHVADWSRDAPILLLCNARSELLDERHAWAGGKLNATSILLEPLTEDESDVLIDHLLSGTALATDVRRRVEEAAEGNPLFVEQMLAMLGEGRNGDTEIAVPPTIQALLAARLDRLDARERTVLEHASVIGTEFWLGALNELVQERSQVVPALQLLVRRELVRPYRSSLFPSDDAFRFRHLLIRDAAYAAMPKELRAELHERFSDWLEGQRSELDEILGYHLEQAYRFRSELGPLDEHGRELGTRAGERLTAAGERALGRFDMPAAAKLLERALAVLPDNHPRRDQLRLGLGDSLAEIDFVRATAVLSRLIDDSEAAGDIAVEWRARVTLLWPQILNDEVTAEGAVGVADAAIETLTALEDDVGLARTWRAAALARNVFGDDRGRDTAMRQAHAYAKRAGDLRLETETAFWVGLGAFYGEMPVQEAMAVGQELFEDAVTPLQRAHAAFWRGGLAVLAGDFNGLADMAQARATYADLGLKGLYGGSAIAHGIAALLAGRPDAAEALTREAATRLEELGERGFRSSVLAFLAESLYAQGRYEDAEQASEESRALTSPEDVLNLSWLASLDGKLAARRGDFDDAEKHARESVRFVEPGGNAFSIGDACAALAEVLQLARRPEAAREAAERALAAYEHRGIAPAAVRMRALLAELERDIRSDRG